MATCPQCGFTFPERERPRALTSRQAKIVELLTTKALSNKEIASLVGTTEQCIKNALSKVYRKAGVRGRQELALACQNEVFRAGLMSSAPCQPSPQTL